MNKLMLVFIFLLFSPFLLASTVNLKFTNTAFKSGRIAIAVFKDADGFPDTGAVLQSFIPVDSTKSSVETSIDLPEGDYAIAFFLDENGNGKLDKNVLGIPKERFGFSNNPTILTGAPHFSECEINVRNDINEFSMKLIKLF